jgi:hypothetical protein
MRIPMFRRNNIILLAIATLLSGALAVPTASADPVFGITCGAGPAGAGNVDIEFSPGLKLLEPRDVTVEVRKDFTNCLTLTDLNLHSGRTDYTVSASSITCLSLLFPTTFTFTINWDDAAHSQSTVTATQTLVGNQVIGAGTVTGGLFAGQQYREESTVLSLSTPLDCLSSTGATRATGNILLLDIGVV